MDLIVSKLKAALQAHYQRSSPEPDRAQNFPQAIALRRAHRAAPDGPVHPRSSPENLRPTLPSSEDVDAFVSSLKGKRILARGPQSLQQLSAACIIKNKAKFIAKKEDGHNNPFAKLPNQLVQDILKTLSDGGEWLCAYFEKAENFCLVLQLLNCFLEEFDYSVDYSIEYSHPDENLEAALFKHMLNSCPKIKKVEITSHVWEDVYFLPRLFSKERLLCKMASKWPNLTSLKISCITSDLIFEAISTNFPLLRFLEIFVYKEMFTKEGKKHLSNLKRLTHLRLHFFRMDFEKQAVIALVHAVGSILSLEKLSFDLSYNRPDSLCESFVDEYGQRFPEKKLLIESLWFESGLENGWPECLTVEELYIQEAIKPNMEFDPKNLLLGNCRSVKKLTICDIAPSKLYPLVEKFGPGLTDLTIELKELEVSLDAHRVVAACPKIQRLKLHSLAGFEKESNCKVSAEHFKNCEAFIMTTNINYKDKNVEVSEMLTLWLLGSKMFLQIYEVGSLMSEIQIDSMVSALSLGEQTCLDQLEEINFAFIPWISPDLLIKVLQLLLCLLERSPYFNKAVIRSKYNFGCCHFEMKLPSWFVETLQKLSVSLSCSRCRRL